MCVTSVLLTAGLSMWKESSKKRTCSLSGQKHNAETVLILRKIYDGHMHHVRCFARIFLLCFERCCQYGSFQLRHVREQILYKESIYLVSVLSSAPRCLFPAAIVVEL